MTAGQWQQHWHVSPAYQLCAAMIGSLRHTRAGPQITGVELGATQRWTRDFRAGIRARDNLWFPFIHSY
jgi:hypothetical protein